jgi:multiple antibiotic resistance protein
VIEAFVSAFVTFFVVIDPPGCAPIFAGLTRDCTTVQRRSMAIRSTLVAAGILIFFGMLGYKLLHALGISLAAFRISGGIMMFMIALDMVFERRTQRREHRAEEVSADPEHNDISVFPMGIPMIAGPGSIASAMLLMARSDGWQASLIVLAAMAAVLVLTLLALLGAAFLMRLLGKRVEAMLTRVLGVILAALAAQFVIDGVAISLKL